MEQIIPDTPFTIDFVLEKLKVADERYKNCSSDLLDNYEAKVSISEIFLLNLNIFRILHMALLSFLELSKLCSIGKNQILNLKALS